MIEKSLIEELRDRFAAAVERVAGDTRDPVIRPAQDSKFGDYQCNVAMALAKPLKRKPREIAEQIVAAVQLDDLAEPLEIAGPGFINIRLRDRALADWLSAIPAPGAAIGDAAGLPFDDRVGLAPVATPTQVVVDYSAPNIAKQMHVGHLRSTIIGDVFARLLGFEGHDVLRQNHVGDWGTQFGMLIVWYQTHPIPTPQTHDDVLGAIEADYKAAQAQFKSDASFATQARQAVGRLQSGDAAARATWEQICTVSAAAFTEIYQRLNVLLTPADTRGESFYNDRLAAVVAQLRETLASGKSPRAEFREDQGAQCIFLTDETGAPAYKGPEGDPLPMIVQKSDGAFLYATTDLTALLFRIRELGARRLVYVTDARQKLHFQMLFDVARAAGWADDTVTLEHVPFGSVLGADRKPLKTREGDNVKLKEVLDEAERRALALLEEREQAADEDAPRFDADEKAALARTIGIGAVKYADLARDRTTDYVFNWDTMLALQGNTAPYMLYAYARIRSIYRKAAERSGEPDVYGQPTPLMLASEAERALALRLVRLRETLAQVASDLTPHVLCGYLFETAQDFMRFYEACPVLAAESEAVRLSRLKLCDLTARTMKLGLGLLGIETRERM